MLAGRQQRSLGESTFVTTSSSAGSVQMLAPGSNVRGVIVRRWAIQLVAGGGVALSAKTGALTGMVDGSPFECVLTGGAGAGQREDILIPAGLGLFYFSQLTGNLISVGYDIL